MEVGTPPTNICGIDGKYDLYISLERGRKGESPSISIMTQWLDLIELWRNMPLSLNLISPRAWDHSNRSPLRKILSVLGSHKGLGILGIESIGGGWISWQGMLNPPMKHMERIGCWVRVIGAPLSLLIIGNGM